MVALSFFSPHLPQSPRVGLRAGAVAPILSMQPESLEIFLCGHRTSIPKPAQRRKVAWSEMSMNTVNTIVPGKHDGLSATLAESMCVREAGIRGAFAPFCGGHSRSFVVIRGHSRPFLSEAAARRSRFALEILCITVIGPFGGCRKCHPS